MSHQSDRARFLILCGIFLGGLSPLNAREVKTVLRAGEHCFAMGEQVEGAKNWLFKLKAQQNLTTKEGALIETIALAHGVKIGDPSENSLVQLAGAAAYVQSGYGEAPLDTIRIALDGNSYSQHEAGSRLVEWNVTLILEPQPKGQPQSGRIIGVKTYRPLRGASTGNPSPSKKTDEGFHINLLEPAPITQSELNEPLIKMSCKAF